MSRLNLALYSSLRRTVEPFEPIEPGHVRMYHCGPTVYGYPHIGNMSAFMLGDLLRRVMEYSGYRVTQVMNITDVGHLTHDTVADGEGEDKLLAAARRLKRTPWDLARHYTQAFFRDLERLGIKAAHYYPRATESVPDMIAMIEQLIEKGFAYEVEGNVYFEVARFERYGKLSGNTLDQLEAGARIEVRSDKRSPFDFALWKKDESHVMQWDSPWGRGFPGWHIECSAMSRRFLGDTFDIHTGGEDNIFPHHECEIAQSEAATGKPFARFWLHTRFMTVDGQKMSKSIGNIYTIEDIVRRGFTGREIRYGLVKTHYRTQPNFSFDVMKDARKALQRIDDFVYKVTRDTDGNAAEQSFPALEEARDKFDRSLEHDMNVSGALAAVFELIRAGNKQELSPRQAHEVLAWLRDIDQVLGVIFWLGPIGDGRGQTAEDADQPEADALSDARIQELLEARTAARAAKDYAAADQIRDELHAAGYEIQDRGEGPRVVRIGG
ncbi:MAG: cysteine--tRNA ligase [Planctomycetota bacterium]|jgi:cysteinyl-tRNA synthetase